jgi:hypothetical protein
VKPGQLVKIAGSTCPMYPDRIHERGAITTHIGYAADGVLCVYLQSVTVNNNVRDLKFFRVLHPVHGPVWVRSVWVKEIDHEAR